MKAAGAVAIAPMIVPSTVFGQTAPSDKVIIGMIGVGTRGDDLLSNTLRKDGLRFAALADCDRDYLLRMRMKMEDYYEIDRQLPSRNEGYSLMPAKQPEGAIDAYNDYRRILDRKDIDAVIAAVPDHWHAKIYIDAMDAGKDVYGEKPIALTINQGRAIARKQAETGRVFQTGSQQRSDALFRKACEYIRNGMLGKIKHVDIGVGGSGRADAIPDSPAPCELDWDLWLGAAPKVPYNTQRCHYNFRWFFDYSGGQVTDWGAHHCDITQWALGMDETGPRYVEGWGKTQQPNYYETFTDFEFTFTYANGITAKLFSGENMVTFHGEKGTLKVNRGFLESNPKDLMDQPLPSDAVRLYVSDDHMQNWLDCIKTRKPTICPAEVGHRSLTLPHIANICGKVGRKLEWDPVKETFVNDNEANQHLDREARAPYHYLAGV